MKRPLAAALALCCLASPTLAEEKKKGAAAPNAASAPEASEAAPAARKPVSEATTKQEVTAFFDQEEALMKKHDFETALSHIDFPLYMVTDDSKGVPLARSASREDYVKEMKPYWDHMPADMKTTHKRTLTVLSASLVSVSDEYRVQMGGKSMSGRNQALLVKRDGQWKWKQMAEAGWGDSTQVGKDQSSADAR
jgi:hypothetical protein